MRKILVYILIIFQIALIISLIRSIQLAINARSRVVDLRENKDRLEKEKSALLRNFEYVKSDYYIEKVAREELQLSKPGETVLIIPEGEQIVLDSNNNDASSQDEPNWKKWWKVVSGKME